MSLSRFYCTIVASLALSSPTHIEGFQAVLSFGDNHAAITTCDRRNSGFDQSSAIVMTMRTPRPQQRMHSSGSTTTTTLSMIDPVTTWYALGGMDAVMTTLVGSGPGIGAAVLGAAAGALSQMPKIQQLNEQVAGLQLELELSQTNLTAKIQLLEDKLFEMDREFEDQTTRFKKQYDTTQRDRLEQIKEKLKMEYQFKLDIQREENKSEQLMKEVDKEHNRTSQQQELSTLALQKQRLEEANVKLEQALLQSEQEREHMLELAAEKGRKRFFLF
jgi:hypothetical protein